MKSETEMTKKKENIRVIIRVRPDEPSEGETCLSHHGDSVEVHPNGISNDLMEKSVMLSASKNRKKAFQFDKVFGASASQVEVYEAVDPLVESAVKGYNATIFAYGSTGSGKTHTISGDGHGESGGIIPRAIERIFQLAQAMTETDSETFVLIHMGYVELYNNQFRDLLDAQSQEKIELHSNRSGDVFLSGSPSLRTPVTSAKQALNLVELGSKLRMTGATDCNERSSRSHSILTFHIESRTSVAGSSTFNVKLGKLHLVDLAGSERLSMSGATGGTLTETQNINLSLSTLGDVLSALSKLHSSGGKKIDRTLIPYRNSKLTYLLKDSLGGNSKTIMIANIRTPHTYRQQTLMTLMYASRAKKIENRTEVNTDTKGDSKTAVLAAEVERLKEQLRKREAAFEFLSQQQLLGNGDDYVQKQRMEQLAALSQENENEKLRLEACLQQVVHNHTSTLAAQQQKYNNLQTKLVEYKTVFDKQRMEIETLRDSIRELSNGATEQEVKQMKNIVEDLARALNQARQETFRKSSELRKLEQQVSDYADKENALNAKIKLLESRHDNLKAASVDALKEVERAHERDRKLQAEVRSLQSQLETKNGSHCQTCASLKEKYNRAISDIEMQVAELLRDKDMKIERLQSQAAEADAARHLQDELDEIKRKKKQAVDENENLMQLLEEKQNFVNNLKAMLQKERGKVTELMDENQNLLECVEEQKVMVQVLRQKVEDAQDIETKNDELNSLRVRFAEFRQERDHELELLNKTVSKLHDDARNREDEHRAMVLNIQSNKDEEISALQKQLNKAKQDLVEMEKRMEEQLASLNVTVPKKDGEIRELKEKLVSSSQESKALRQQLEEESSLYHETLEKLKLLQKDRESLLEELTQMRDDISNYKRTEGGKMDQLRAQVGSQKQDIEALHNINNELLQNIERLNRDNETLVNQSNVQEEKGKENDTLQGELDQVSMEKEVILNKLRQLEDTAGTTIKDLRDKTKQQQIEIETLNHTIQNTRKTLEEYKHRMEELEVQKEEEIEALRQSARYDRDQLNQRIADIEFQKEEEMESLRQSIQREQHRFKEIESQKRKEIEALRQAARLEQDCLNQRIEEIESQKKEDLEALRQAARQEQDCLNQRIEEIESQKKEDLEALCEAARHEQDRMNQRVEMLLEQVSEFEDRERKFGDTRDELRYEVDKLKTENAELHDKESKQGDHITRLKQENEQLLWDRERLQSQLDEKEQALRLSEERLQSVHTKKVELEASFQQERSRLHTQIADLETALKEAKSEHAEIVQISKERQTQIVTLQSSLELARNETKKAITASETRIAELAAALESAQEENASLEREVEGLADRLNHNYKDMENNRDHVTSVQNTLSKLEAESKRNEQQLQQENAKMRSEVETAKMDMSNLEQRLREKESDFKMISKKSEDTIHNLRQKLQDMTDKAVTLEQHKNEDRADLEERMKQLTFERDEEVKTLEQHIQTLAKDLEQFKQMTTVLEQKLENAQAQETRLEAEMKQMESIRSADTAQLETHISELAQTNERLQKDLAEAASRESEMELKIENLRLDKGNLENLADKLRGQVADLLSLQDRLGAEADAQTSAMSSLTQENQMLMIVAEQAERRCESLSAQLLHAEETQQHLQIQSRKKLEQLEAKLSELHGALEREENGLRLELEDNAIEQKRLLEKVVGLETSEDRLKSQLNHFKKRLHSLRIDVPDEEVQEEISSNFGDEGGEDGKEDERWFHLIEENLMNYAMTIEELNMELHESKQSNELLENKLRVQHEWLEDLKGQRDSLEDSVVEARQEAERLRDALAVRFQTETELKLTKEANQKLEMSLEELKLTIGNLSQDNSTLLRRSQIQFIEKTKTLRFTLAEGMQKIYGEMDSLLERLASRNGSLERTEKKLARATEKVNRTVKALKVSRTKKLQLVEKLAHRNKAFGEELGVIKENQKKLLSLSAVDGLHGNKENSRLGENSMDGTNISFELGEYQLSILNACLNGNLQVLENALKMGFLKNDFANDGMFLPLHRAISGLHFHGNTATCLQIIQLLVHKGVPINTKDKAGNTVLHRAIQVIPSKDVTPAVQALVKLGADVNAYNKLGDTPLHTEIRRLRNNSLEIVKILVAAGAKVNAKGTGNNACSPMALMESISNEAAKTPFFNTVLSFLRDCKR